MVGTAVTQLGRAASSQPKKRNALKPGVQQTEPPAASEASTAAISPWMWNSGMMLRHASSGVSASTPPMCFADAQTLACVSGTIFGRDVVPEVCSISATSAASAGPGVAAIPAAAPCRVNAPAASPGVSSSTATPAACAACRAGPSWPAGSTTARAPRSAR